MKKKIMAALLAGVMVLAVGCGGSKTESENITLGQYKGLTLTSVSQATVDAEISSILEGYTEFVTVDREAKEGDTVNINFVGTMNGEVFEGGTDDSEAGTNLELGSNMFIDGFEEGLIGCVTGEERVLELTFPEDYYEDMAGKEVVFTVTVNKVQEKVVPELTDEFVASNLGEYNTVDEFVNGLRENLNNTSYYEQVMELVVGSSEITEYPEDLVKEETDRMVEYYLSYAEYYASMTGLDTVTALYYVSGLTSEEELRKSAEEYAYHMVKNTMVLEEIASVEDIKVSEEEYNKRVLEYAASYGYDDVAAFETDYGKEEIEGIILLDVVMEFLVDEAIIVDAE